MQLLTARETSTCCFFLDIRASFDSVCREYVATFRKYGPEVAADAAGLGREECDLLTRRILEEGSALELAGASEHLNVLIADLLHNTWFSTVGVDGDIVRTSYGAIPGDPLGDILFAFLGARVKHTILLELHAAGLVLKVSRPIGSDPLGLGSDHEMEEALDTSYIDDDTIVVTAEEAGLLVDRAAKAAAIIAKVYRRYKFDFNYSPGKSEAFVAFRGKGAKLCRIKLATAGSTIDFDDGKVLVKMRAVHRYIHLVTSAVITGSIDSEISHRVNAAAGALASVRQILKTGLGIKMNVMCIKLYVFPRLFYGAGAWPSLSDKNLNKLRKTYLQAVRLAFKQNWDGDRDLLTNSELFAKFDIDTVEDVVTSMRLKLFSKLVPQASEALRTLLSATAAVKGTFANAVVLCFSIVRVFSKLAGFPEFEVDPHRWADL